MAGGFGVLRRPHWRPSDIFQRCEGLRKPVSLEGVGRLLCVVTGREHVVAVHCCENLIVSLRNRMMSVFELHVQ